MTVTTQRKEVRKSNSHGPAREDFTRHKMDGAEGSQTARWRHSQKTDRRPDWRLKLVYMKTEALEIEGQHSAVNTFPGLVYTARHTMRVGCARSREPDSKEGAYHGVFHDWGEVVTR